MECSGLKYSEIQSKDVIDSNGEKVGEVMDWIFDYADNKLDLKYIVIGGGWVEELLESIGARPDIDPVIKFEDVDSISDKVYLKVDGESLKNTIDPGVLTESDISFSKLSDIKVIDSDGFKVGFVIDIWFDLDNVMWLLLGGGFFEELLERLKVQPDVDLLVPPHFIENLNSNEIKLSITKNQFQSTCKNEFNKLKKQAAGDSPPEEASFAQLKLGTAPK